MIDEEGIYQLFNHRVQATVHDLVGRQGFRPLDAKRLNEELEPILRLSAKKLAANPIRLNEAMGNLDRLLLEIERQALTRGTAFSLNGVLRWLCPIFPFC